MRSYGIQRLHMQHYRQELANTWAHGLLYTSERGHFLIHRLLRVAKWFDPFCKIKLEVGASDNLYIKK